MRALQFRLAEAQVRQIVHKRRLIVLFDGWIGAGKKTALRRMVGSWDPCFVDVITVDRAIDSEEDRHWLAPYWSNLPAAGHTSIFYSSWYRRVVELKMAGRLDDKRFARACDEINEFEAQQCDHGTTIVKLFFHLSAERQAAVLRERQQDSWRHHLLSAGAAEAMSRRDELIAAGNEMFAQTDTRWAPWKLINGNDEVTSSIQAMEILASVMEKTIPADPPKEGDTILPFRQSRAG